MLPSKGYFSGMPCPFYDSSICERPHCHFRHSKKDKINVAGGDTSKSQQNNNAHNIKELVTKTVEHVLSHTEIRDRAENSGLNSDIIVTDINTFKPNIESKIDTSKKDFSNSTEIPSYRPTPISELNKKHIPVAYAPTRPNYLDRYKRKEYTPKCLSGNSQPVTTYVPSSSKGHCEAYSPENVSSCKYYASQISSDGLTVTNDDGNNSESNYKNESSIKGTLEALDKLIDDEFNVIPESDNSNKNSEKLVENSSNITVKSSVDIVTEKTERNDSFLNKNSVSPDKIGVESISDGSIASTCPKFNSAEKHSKKSDVSNYKSSHEKHVNSKTKLHSFSSSKQSSTNGKKSSHSKKTTDSHQSATSKHISSSHEKHSSSKSKDCSKSKSSKSIDHHSKHSGECDKSKVSNSSKKSVKDKCKISESKEKSHSSTSSISRDKKKNSKSTSHEDKTHKNDKLKENSKHRKKSQQTSAKCLKKTSIKKKSKDPTVSDLFFKLDSLSDNSELEEVQFSQEPILIDSSSSSPDLDPVESISQSPVGNFDLEHESFNISSSSDNACDSPPPRKRFKKSDVKSTSNSFQSSILSDRWKKARETVKNSTISSKIRIAHVPNVTSLLVAKDKIIAKSKLPPKDDLTVCKKPQDDFKDPDCSKRVRKAHVPSQKRQKYPSLIMEENLKVPTSIRQLCLNNLFEEYFKYCDEDEARLKAQTDELEICRRVHVPKTYQSSVALSLLKIRKLQGKKGADTEILTNKLLSDSIPDFTYGWTIYKCFSEYLMKEEEFVSHGFPIRLESKPGYGYIEKSARRYDVKQPDDLNLRICSNCSNNYYVDEKGFPLKEFDCFYHWGRLGRTRVRGGVTEFYRCCNGEIGSEPCTTGRYHVCSNYNEDCLEGFVTSRPTSDEPAKAGIYAIDCEMCYTTRGLDLTRCTIVDINGKMVYDEVVIPENPILDYNTRFSGITEDMIIKSRKRLRHVQRDLLKLINEKSILLGHSLENDFKALRLFHRTVVDTSIVFPHNLGLPYKKALKFIAKDILKINIQENESGHDSYEDANTCMLIMMAKVKEDAKKRKPRVIISLDSKVKINR